VIRRFMRGRRPIRGRPVLSILGQTRVARTWLAASRTRGNVRVLGRSALSPK
jgi:hypothetical protein